MSKNFELIIKSKMISILLVFIIGISIINAQDNVKIETKDKNVEADAKKETNNKKEESNNNQTPKENKNIKFINCDKFCSKFESSCPSVYNEVTRLATEYILDNKIIESNVKEIPFEIPKAFFYKGIYEYYGIVSDSSSPNLENGLLNFIIAGYFGSQEANYRLYILYESDLISHIIYTSIFQNFLKNDKILQLISKTEYWNNFNFFYKYPDSNSTNEKIRHNLQNQIGYNFLYLSILKKYNPAMLVGGTKYATGVGVEKRCEVATQFIKEVSFQNIAGKINHPEMKGNFVFTRFRLEVYEHIDNIYKKENQLTTLESLFQIYNLLKDDSQDISRKKEVINEIGLRYFYGIGTEKNYQKAKEWFEYGTNYKIGQCYAFLGEIYLHGFGLKKEEIDYKKANVYFNQALIYGETAMGYSGLGYMYYYGLGLKKDKKEAYNCFLKGIRNSGKESSWEVTSLYFNMISLLIEDDSEDEEEFFETKSIFNDMFVDFDIKEKDEINNNINIENEKDNKKGINDKSNANTNINTKNNEKQNNNAVNTNKNDKKDNTGKVIDLNNLDKLNDDKEPKTKKLFDNKVPKDFNLAYKYANYLTLKNRSYGTYILAMMNDYNINAKLFSCEENLNFFRATSETNEDTINRVEIARKLYENKKYRSSFLIMMELAYEGYEDSIPNVIALLTKRQIFKNHDYQKYLTYYFIELGLKLEYYDLFFLSLSAKFFYKEQDYKKSIELYKLLINHAGGNDKKTYIAEGFFNLGLMENFGYGLAKNITKSNNFFEKSEKYDITTHYPVKIIRFINRILKLMGDKNYKEEAIYFGNKTSNDTNANKGFLNRFFNKINIFSFAVTIFLLFYGWFFFNLKYQPTIA